MGHGDAHVWPVLILVRRRLLPQHRGRGPGVRRLLERLAACHPGIVSGVG
jgi:hypothetical protein